MKKCSNCGKMNLNSADVCKSCQCECFGEYDLSKVVKHEQSMEQEKSKETPMQEVVSHRNKHIWRESIGLSIFAYLPCCLVVLIISFILNMFLWGEDSLLAKLVEKIMNYGAAYWLTSALLTILIGVVNVIWWKLKSPREKIISVQFEKDQTSICPVCGSHDVVLGRKGYDWKKGFWYRIFNVKGGHYLAGMNSRRVTAYCQNCSHSWVTDKEWIK